jgi:SynChlorMet cassette radical SAM/SPASM protein ScmF
MARGKGSTYPLTRAYLYLSGGCNLRCAHCWISPGFVPDGGTQGDQLTVADVKKVIDQGKPLGLSSAKLTGGEPFLNPEVFEIIALTCGEKLSVSIETNGTLIDLDAAHFLKQRGVGSVSVSIDSHRPSFHDAFRGVEGSLDRAARGVERLVAEGIPVQIIMSLIRENAADIEGLVDLAKRVGASSVKINPVNPIGRGGFHMDRDETLPVDELLNLLGWVEGELSHRYGIETFFTVPSAFKPISHLFDGRNAQCHVLNIIGILSDGDVSLCGIGRQEPRLVMGNIRADHLARIWRESPVLAALRETVPDKMEGICGRCIMKGICLGSCRADAYVLSGSLAAPHWICREAADRGLFPQARVLRQ